MGEGFLNFGRLAWLIGVAMLVLVANVLASILYMIVYGHLIDPGHTKEYYDAHIQIAAPYCSIAAGIPLMFLAGYCVSRWWDGKFAIQSAVVVWLAYAVIDLAIMMAAGAISKVGLLVGISLVTKLAAAYVGAIVGSRRTA